MLTAIIPTGTISETNMKREKGLRVEGQLPPHCGCLYAVFLEHKSCRTARWLHTGSPMLVVLIRRASQTKDKKREESKENASSEHVRTNPSSVSLQHDARVDFPELGNLTAERIRAR